MDKNQPDAVFVLHRWGFQVRSDVTLPPRQQRWREPTLSREEFKQRVRGRADLFVSIGGRAAAIECKVDRDRFSFDNLEPEKHKWVTTYCRPEPTCMEYWIWLTLGRDEPHLNPEKYRPMRTWLIPYAHWLAVEDAVRPYQDSIPYLARTGQLAKLGYDAIRLFGDFELPWKNSKEKWGIFPSHPFYQMYIAPPALPLYQPETVSIRSATHASEQLRSRKTSHGSVSEHRSGKRARTTTTRRFA